MTTGDDRHVPWWVEEGKDDAFIASSPYVWAIWMWGYMVRRCHDFFARPEIQDSVQVLLLRYEDFMEAPMEVGPTVLDHLGAEPTSAFWRRLEQAHSQSIGKYAARSEDEIRAAEEVTGTELTLYGYDLHTRVAKSTPSR